MRLVYLTIGFVSLGLGNHWDSFTDFTDDSPFLLLSMACFAKVPNALKRWLYQIKLYQTYVADYREIQIDCQRTEEMDPSSDLHSDGDFDLSGSDYLGEACSRCFDDFLSPYYLLKVIPNKPENPTEENPD